MRSSSRAKRRAGGAAVAEGCTGRPSPVGPSPSFPGGRKDTAWGRRRAASPLRWRCSPPAGPCPQLRRSVPGQRGAVPGAAGATRGVVGGDGVPSVPSWGGGVVPGEPHRAGAAGGGRWMWLSRAERSLSHPGGIPRAGAEGTPPGPAVRRFAQCPALPRFAQPGPKTLLSPPGPGAESSCPTPSCSRPRSPGVRGGPGRRTDPPARGPGLGLRVPSWWKASEGRAWERGGGRGVPGRRGSRRGLAWRGRGGAEPGTLPPG